MGRVDINATQYHQGLQLQENQGSNHPPPPHQETPPPPPAENQYFPPPPPAAADQPYPPPPTAQPSHHVPVPNNSNDPWSSVIPATHQESPKSSSSSEDDRPGVFPPPEDAMNPPPHQAENPPHAFPPPPSQQHEYHPYNSAADEQPQSFPLPQHEFQEETPQAFPPPSSNTHQFVHQFPPPQQSQSPFPTHQQTAAFPTHQQTAAFPPQQQNGFVAGIPMVGQPNQFMHQPQILNNNQPSSPFQNNHPISPFIQPQPQFNPWSSSLFDCMNDPQNAIITACFPCVTFGQIAEIVDAGNTSCSSGGMMYGCIAFLIAMPCLMSCGYRTKIRSKFGLIESPAPDWFVHCFCEWCALCQEYRELQARGLDPSIGWAGNVAEQMQQQRVHMTPPMQQRMM